MHNCKPIFLKHVMFTDKADLKCQLKTGKCNLHTLLIVAVYQLYSSLLSLQESYLYSMVLPKNPPVPWLCISPLLLLNCAFEGVKNCPKETRGGWTIVCFEMLASPMYEWGGMKQSYGSHALTTSFHCACLEISHKSCPPPSPTLSKVSASCFLCVCWCNGKLERK